MMSTVALAAVRVDDDALRHAVAVRQVIGYIAIVFLLQERIDHCYGGGAVHIVIAIYHDALMPFYGIGYPIYSLLHAAHQIWVM